MNEARFAPPVAPVADVVGDRPFVAPPGVQFKIRLALLLVILAALFQGLRVMQSVHVGQTGVRPVLGLVEPALQLALAFGVYRGSRVCAMLMLFFAVVPTLAIYLYVGLFVANELWIMLVCASCLAVYATLELHMHRRRALALS